MDPDCSICKERASPMLFADTERPYQTKRPFYLIYSLLVFSYILILTLFILVLYKTTFTSSQAEIKNDLRSSPDTDQTFSTYTEKQLTNLGKDIDTLKQDNGTRNLLPKYLSILKILQNQVLEQENFSRKIEEQLHNNTNDIGMVKKQVDELRIQHPEYLSNLKNLQKQVEELSSRINTTRTIDEGMSCENDWVYFRGSCYLFSTITSDWTHAREACKKEGADLVVITSSVEQRFIISEISVRKSINYWIGLHDMDEENDWQWVDGTNYVTSYKNWNQGEPNNAHDKEDCVHTKPNGKWNDVHCTYNEDISALCKRKV